MGVQILSETEKAIQTFAVILVHSTEKEIWRKVWIPKTQLSEDGVPGQWISRQKHQDLVPKNVYWGSDIYWQTEDGLVDPGYTPKEEAEEQARQEAMDRGLEYNAELLKFAKANGVKGVRARMKTSTLLKKIAKAGLDAPAKN